MIKKVKINDIKIFDTDKLNEALILLNEQLEFIGWKNVSECL